MRFQLSFVVIAGVGLCACQSLTSNPHQFNLAVADETHPPCAVERALVRGVAGKAPESACRSQQHPDYFKAHADGMHLAQLREEHARLKTKVYLQSMRLDKNADALTAAEQELLATFSSDAAVAVDQTEVDSLRERQLDYEAQLLEYRAAEQAAAQSLAEWGNTLASRYQ